MQFITNCTRINGYENDSTGVNGYENDSTGVNGYENNCTGLNVALESVVTRIKALLFTAHHGKE